MPAKQSLSNDMTPVAPLPPGLEALHLVIGPPRSGTTLISNAIMAHSSVTGVMEPYQRGRKTGFAGLDVEDLYPSGPPPTRNLVLKETCTRLENVTLSFAALERARARGLYTSAILILRCPFSAYLSQVEASRDRWKEKKLVEVSAQSLAQWARMIRQGLREICTALRAQHFRVVCYEDFCANPGPRLARLMALFPERIEPGQLNFAPAPGTIGQADPKVVEKAGRIELTDYTDALQMLRDMFSGTEDFSFIDDVATIIAEHSRHRDDRLTLDRLFLRCTE
jgi:hypothetical protein